jgi:hypothetical protein
MSPAAPRREGINFISIAVTILVLLSSWTLKTVYDISNGLTAATTRIDQHDRTFGAIDARVRSNETEITNLRIHVANGRAGTTP